MPSMVTHENILLQQSYAACHDNDILLVLPCHTGDDTRECKAFLTLSLIVEAYAELVKFRLAIAMLTGVFPSCSLQPLSFKNYRG